MKFQKILTIGISPSQLELSYWKEIDKFCLKRVSLQENSTELDKNLRDADALLVYFNGVSKEMIDKAPNLKYIGALATGVGKINSTYAKRRGIVVCNIPGYSTESVAEFIFAVLLENLREITRAKKESLGGNRSEAGFSGREIKDKTFGVVGVGRIGERVSEIAQTFGADVIYWSKHRKKDLELGKLKFVDLDKLLQESDFISVNLALNPQTENILDAKRILKIKKGAVVINTAPMELLDLKVLDRRLSKGEITFIFDHTDLGDISEKDLKMLQAHKTCITYPAIGYISQEAKVAKQEIFIRNIKSFLEGVPINQVY